MGDTEVTLRADAARNRERILDAARDIFAELGAAAGMEDVARRAGVGKGTLYRRFPTKDALLEAVVEQRFDQLEAAVAGHEGASLTRLLTTTARMMVDDRGLVDLLSEDATPELRERCGARYMALAAPLLAAAQAAGVARADLVPDDVVTLLKMVGATPEERRDRALELLRDGLAPRSGSVAAAIRSRRTHKAYAPQPLDRATIEELIDLARWAPNHHVTNPWRFRVVGPRALAALKEAAGPEAAAKLDRAPTLLAVSCVLAGEDPIADEEDLFAAACATYIVLLAAHARGLVGYWRTPGVLRTAAGRAALALGEGERTIGLVYLGHPRQQKPAPERAPVAAVTTYLD